MVYLLQEIQKVEVGYSFGFDTYLNNEIRWDAKKMTRAEAIGKIRELRAKLTETVLLRGMAELSAKHGVKLVFAA